MKKNSLLTLLIILIATTFIGCGKTENNQTGQDDYKEEQVQSTENTDDSEEYDCSTSEIDENGYAIAPVDFMEGVVNIPDEYMDNPVVELEDYAFATHQITEVEMGDNVVKIGESAFFDCSDLKKVKLNEKLKIIGKSAFLQAGLEGDLVIPDSVEKIESMAFGLTGLETIHVGKGVKFIGAQALVIDSLKKVVFDCKDVEFEAESIIFSEDCKDLTIVAPKGSTAEKYAKDNNIKFEER